MNAGIPCLLSSTLAFLKAGQTLGLEEERALSERVWLGLYKARWFE